MDIKHGVYYFNGKCLGINIKRIESLPKIERLNNATELAPILSGFCSSERSMIGHFIDDDRVLEFINSNNLNSLAPLRTNCPDHFLRTKISQLVLDLAPTQDLSDVDAIKWQLQPAFEAYRKMYQDYFKTCKHDNSPAIRDSNPVVIIYLDVGMFTFSKDKQTARVAAEFIPMQ